MGAAGTGAASVCVGLCSLKHDSEQLFVLARIQLSSRS